MIDNPIRHAMKNSRARDQGSPIRLIFSSTCRLGNNFSLQLFRAQEHMLRLQALDSTVLKHATAGGQIPRIPLCRYMHMLSWPQHQTHS